MKVSVIIPVYNRCELLKDAIESVFFQSYKNVEIIVIDDGSDRDIRHCLKPYMPKIKYIRLVRNFGVSHARNVGIENASGEFIAFLDSDDLWMPSKLSEQLNVMINENYFVCHTDEFWYKKGRFVNQGKKHKKYGGRIFRHILDICRISPSSVLLSRKAVDVCGRFNESLAVSEDYDYWLRVACSYEVAYIPRKLVVKRSFETDQLSIQTPYMEYYRLLAISSFLRQRFSDLCYNDRVTAIKELSRKFNIVKNGVRHS